MRTFSLEACFIVLFSSGSQGQLLRKLSYECCAGYEPASDIISHSRIDLDQKEMEAYLKDYNFEGAKAIYTSGGNSGARARIILAAPITDTQPKGAPVKQGQKAVGVLKGGVAKGATSITVTYTSTCKDGGLATKDLSGCFTTGMNHIMVGTLDVGGPQEVQNTYRTLAGFSTEAETKMDGQEYYAVYKAYYNSGDYAHKRVMDALTKSGICSSCDAIAQVEIAKKTSSYMNVWMYVIREMEDAIIDCKSGCLNCNDDPVHAWDEAVAFYTGSLEGFYADDDNKPGMLLHELADKRCKNFGTCSKGEGRSDVNAKIIGEFRKGQAKLLGGKCVDAIPIKRRIVELMSVPLVQGALRYAWKLTFGERNSKSRAEGDAFTAAILPRVAACNPTSAEIIKAFMNYDYAREPGDNLWHKVKVAFESTYICLGITCEDVGGVIKQGKEYEKGAEPCVTSKLMPTALSSAPAPAAAKEESSGLAMEMIIVIVVGGLILASCCAFVAWKSGFARGRNYARFESNGHDGQTNGNDQN
eukprot:gnl/MRDRNA2_/MRDRNA2_85550_c0_seq1.p1 gnl/MRDRNA2_/MRDRNA2_85550_c0~~gnl/MRDRNA2_/MRDRNA2_85550_c0_seq1.p1  ORF type:complete len:529 (+),score=87.51 gnl/MRDRNA2_/MRDRNA2_85550_c0_seq1:125-1711(+)